MDYVYHAVVGLGISKTLSGIYDPAAALFALLPDVVGLTPFIYLKLKNTSHGSLTGFIKNSFNLTKTDNFFNSLDRSMYRATHSLLCTLILAVFLYFVFPRYWLAWSLSYLSHILIDIPTHDGDFATRLLYPFSDMHYEGKNWMKNGRQFIFFWGVLILAGLLFLT